MSASEGGVHAVGIDIEGLRRRIAGRVERDGSCVVWQGATINGQPYTKVAGKQVPVSRVMWGLERQTEPPDRIYRVCGNGLCVNPWHLGDYADIPEDEAGGTNWSWADDEHFMEWLRAECRLSARGGARAAGAPGPEFDDVLSEAMLWLSGRRPRRNRDTAKAAAREGYLAARRDVDAPEEYAWHFDNEFLPNLEPGRARPGGNTTGGVI